MKKVILHTVGLYLCLVAVSTVVIWQMEGGTFLHALLTAAVANIFKTAVAKCYMALTKEKAKPDDTPEVIRLKPKPMTTAEVVEVAA